MSVPEIPIPCAEFESRLSDYLENALSPAEHGAMDAHLHECNACGELVRDVQNIVREAHALPLLAPSRDLWSGIESRLASPVVVLTDHAVKVSSKRVSRTFSLRQFAAAAILLVTTSSGVTYLLTRTTPAAPAKSNSASVATTNAAADTTASVHLSAPTAVAPLAAEPERVASTTLAESSLASRPASYGALTADVTYEREIKSMRSLVNERLSELDPKTVKEIERNFTIIDKAIADSRDALARDPRSGFLATQLDRALQTKLATMRKVALL
jgi:hypothetical protein